MNDSQWDLIKGHLPTEEASTRKGIGRPWRSAREVLNGVLWVLRTGAPWSDLPERFPSYQTCHRRFQRWARMGVLARMLTGLRVRLCRRGGIEDVEAYIDGSYVPAKNGGDCVGTCCAGNATKVMALADREGLPLSIAVAPGNRHDIVLTDKTLDATFVAELPERLIGDKAWDSSRLQARLAQERGIILIAPKRRGSHRVLDGRVMRRYRRRWRVESLFAALKQMRRLANRWERKISNFLGLLQLGCMVILLRSRC